MTKLEFTQRLAIALAPAMLDHIPFNAGNPEHFVDVVWSRAQLIANYGDEVCDAFPAADFGPGTVSLPEDALVPPPESEDSPAPAKSKKGS